LSNAELLAILLRSGTRKKSVLRIAEEILARIKEQGLVGMVHISVAELAKIDGYHTKAYPAKGSWMDQLMPKENKGSYLDSKFQQEVKALLGDLYEPMMELRQTVKDGSYIQARMLDDVRVK
jgi:DNA repair protein RadC